MEYNSYTFRKKIASPRGGWMAEAQQHLQPLEQICREEGGIVTDDIVHMPASDVYTRIQTLLVGNVVVKHSVYLYDSGRSSHSSVQTNVLYAHKGVEVPPLLDKIRSFYGTDPAFTHVDSEHRFAGEHLASQGLPKP